MAGLWGDKDEKTSTGTVAVAANGLVTGSGTSFATEARVGDFIRTDAEALRIVSITNATSCHVQAQTLGGVIATAAANQYGLQEAPQYVALAEVDANAAGVFGIDTTEIGISGGILALSLVTNGSGYFSNAAVTISGGGGASGAANAEANSIGQIATIHLTNVGTGYETIPTITIAAPAAQAFNANTAVATNGFITITTNVYQVNDLVTYAVAAGNTALAELASDTVYHVQAANTTGVYLAATSGGAALTLTKGATETGHTLQGETATAVGTGVSGAVGSGVAHAGWIRRTVGTGNKAGRISTEVLVASRLAGDAADDSYFPDS